MAIGRIESEDDLRGFVLRVLRDAPVARLVRQLQGAVISGSGSPAGVLDAPVGTLYRRLDGGAGTSLYVKEAAGMGGWVAK